jgi:pilus assembly protein CpaB
MVKRRLIIALVVALLVSGIFTFWLSKKIAGNHGGTPSRLRYVGMAADLDAGAVLRAEDLQQIDWPANARLEGATAKPEDVIGRTLLYPVAKGEPILQRQLSAPGMGAGLFTKIPDGMRAISLKSDQVVGVAGFLLPGTHIDVLVTYRSPSSTEAITSTVLQDARILAAGQKTQPDPEGKASSVDVVTLLVTPSDAEKVVLASTQGTVHFVLRNGSDHEHVTDQPAQMSVLGEIPRAKQVLKTVFLKPETPMIVRPYSVETLRGDKRTVENF